MAIKQSSSGKIDLAKKEEASRTNATKLRGSSQVRFDDELESMLSLDQTLSFEEDDYDKIKPTASLRKKA